MNVVACRQCSSSKLHTHMSFDVMCSFRQALSLTFPVFNVGETWSHACPSGRSGRARVVQIHNPIPPGPAKSAASMKATAPVRSRLMSGGAHRLASIDRRLGLSAPGVRAGAPLVRTGSCPGFTGNLRLRKGKGINYISPDAFDECGAR